MLRKKPMCAPARTSSKRAELPFANDGGRDCPPDARLPLRKSIGIKAGDDGAFGVQQYTVKQVAAIYQVHPKTVLRWIKDGKLVATRKDRLIRISLKSLRDFMHDNAP